MPGWDDYYLGVARAVAARADCSRRQVGAVIVKDQTIVSTGYNGSAPGGPSCWKGECPRGSSSVAPDSSYDSGPGACISIHAEMNAMLRASWAEMQGATLYCTDNPCPGCAKAISGSGIARVVSPFGTVWP